MAQNSRVMEEPIHFNGSGEQIHKTQIFWRKVILMVYLHLAGLYGSYLMTKPSNWKTSLFAFILIHFYGLGVTAGAHRLWSHRSYKARWPLRVLLCILNSGAAQQDIYKWSRDHRVHHKFTETNADPHNIKRGLFFAHMGWLMCKKHPDVVKKGKTISMEDVWADPIVRFQKRFYFPLAIFFSVYLPTMIPVWFWGETAWNSFFIASIARYVHMSHYTWLVNSAAHKYGDRPFNKHIEARDYHLTALLSLGEGWHNYHHAFPWDYVTSELGFTFNLTKVFIDFMAIIGLAYDLKVTDANTIKNKKLKSGDGSRLHNNDNIKHTLNGS